MNSEIIPRPSAPVLPALITQAGEKAAWRFLEFFTVNIRNKNTRAAYGQAAGAFLRWCEDRGIRRIEDVQPMHVAGYIEELGKLRKAPTVKQHLACIRMLFEAEFCEPTYQRRRNRLAHADGHRRQRDVS